MPGFTLQPAEVSGLIAFIRAGFDITGAAVKVGHVGRGQALFEGKGACGTCHRVNGKGPRVAPELTDIGAIRTPAALQRSLLDPTSAMLPINRPVRAVTRDGRTVRGRRLNEDTYTIQLIDEQERLVSLVKADLREYEVATKSPMPSYAKTFSGDEIADLIAYCCRSRGLMKKNSAGRGRSVPGWPPARERPVSSDRLVRAAAEPRNWSPLRHLREPAATRALRRSRPRNVANPKATVGASGQCARRSGNRRRLLSTAS
jgi:putative heme-binding domain-containing protein